MEYFLLFLCRNCEIFYNLYQNEMLWKQMKYTVQVSFDKFKEGF